MTDSLPPGQRERASFPRFGLTKFAYRFPKDVNRPEILVTGEVETDIRISDELGGLPRIEQRSDFHCVTTWTRRGLLWGGVRVTDFFDRIVRPQARPAPDATFVILRAQDGARTLMLLEDLLQPDVLLADRLDGEPLPVEHGAPLRLVAPAHYGYKSIKHLNRIEFHRDDSRFRPSAFRFMDHPRARVEFEERGRGAPGILLRYLYRPLIGTTVRRFDRAMRSYREQREAGQ